MDKGLVIYSWKENPGRLAVLKKTSELPGKLPDIQEYFDRAFERKTGGILYVSVYLGHDKPFRLMHKEIDWWLAGHNYGWYYKALQCVRSSCIGWLLYSTLDME